ncbi:tripartite tricarboxylate transporter TctB family protein [Devosia sp. A369]
MGTNTKDIAAGTFFIAVGAWFSINAWFTLSIGTISRMGAGYFPIVLGVLLVLMGGVIVFRSVSAAAGPIGRIPIRGLIMISLAPVVFGLTVRGLGLPGAVFLSMLFAAFSSTRVTVKTGIALALGIAVFCTIIFHYGLSLPIDLVGPWLKAWKL